VAIIGGLFLLLSETQNQDNARQPSAVAGVPQPEPPKDKRAKSMLLLSGRILLPLMFVSLLRWEPAAPMRMVGAFLLAIFTEKMSQLTHVFLKLAFFFPFRFPFLTFIPF